MSKGPWLVTVGQAKRRFACLVCLGALFYDREIKLNTSGAEFFDIGWANESGVGLVCDQCGYLHTFVSGSVEFWEPNGGYPTSG